MNSLKVIGIPVVEHCNLNCKGCLHFCHKGQEKYFASVNMFENDLRRLKCFFDNIDIIRLYGGEPFLHAGLYKFIVCCKKIFPRSEVEILTNGILLTKSQFKLIETIKEYSAKICWSVYPLISEEKYRDNINFLEFHRLKYEENIVKKFYTCFDFSGGLDKSDSFKKCNGKFCHVLREGKISCCPAPLVGHHINKFGANIDFTDGILDLYEKDVTTKKIMNFLQHPHSGCCYCSSPQYFEWELQGEKVTLDDWKKK